MRELREIYVLLYCFAHSKNAERVLPGGFEPPSPAPKAGMIDHYTTGVFDFSSLI